MIYAKAIRIKSYDKRFEQFRTNRLFQQNKKIVYQQLNGKTESSETPDTEESMRFLSNISKRKESQ